VSSGEGKSARRKFIEALTDNWWQARKAYLHYPTTRDEKYVWEAVRRARTIDVWELEGKSPALVIPWCVELMGDARHVEPSEVGKVNEGDTVRPEIPRRMTPALMAAWLEFHPRWVRAEVRRVVAEAEDRLRRTKRDLAAERRKNRNDRRVTRRGKRRYKKRPGPRPSLRVQVRKIGATKSKRKNR
jgi:hypothetical protein